MDAKVDTPHDASWFETLYLAHYQQIRAYVQRRTQHHIDDVVAEVFTVAWRRRDVVPAHTLPWLYTVASHELQRSRRTANRQATLAAKAASVAAHLDDPAVPTSAAPLDDDVANRILAQQLLAQLSDADAEVLRLAMWEQLPPADIARVLGCSSVTARVRLHRAKSKAATLLQSLDRPTPARRTPAAASPKSAPERSVTHVKHS